MHQKKLKLQFDKQYLNSILNYLKKRDFEEKNGVKDPVLKKIKISRSNDFLLLWSLYINTLFPLLTGNKIKKMELIHIIFGNQIEQTIELWFHWPILQQIATKRIKRELQDHVNFIKHGYEYEIRIYEEEI